MRFRAFAITACLLLSTAPVMAQPIVIRACVNMSNGDIRLLTGVECPPNRILVTWDVQGPQGPRGLPGEIGPTGPQGPVGPQGPAGVSGAIGPAGPTGLTGAVGPAGPDGAAGATGADGPQGPAGPQGASGVDGRNGPLVVDANDQEVGILTDPMNAIVVRKVGDDAVWFTAPGSGVSSAPINFFHSAADCTDPRYLQIMGGQGLAYFGSLHGGAIFYTKTLDPFYTVAVTIRAYEHFDAGQDATLPGRCIPYNGGTHSLGVVTTAIDPAVATFVGPLHVR